MNAKQIADYIIDHYARIDSEWLTDIILLALRKLYDMDELAALECEPEIKDRVKDVLNRYVAHCRERQVPPKIRLSNDALNGNQRPELLDHLHKTIRGLEPFEFQRLCCIYIRDHMGYLIEAVYRRNGGADVLAKRDVFLVGQARRHREKMIGKDELSHWVLQVKENYPGAAFAFLAATLYSDPAMSYARQVYVKLVDGEQIAYFLLKEGVPFDKVNEWLTAKCGQGCTTAKCDLKPT